MNRILRLLALTCALAMTIPGAFAQVVWQRSSANPVLPEWSGLVDDPSGYKYVFEGSVMYDSTARLYRMWFTSLAEGSGTSFVISRAISLDGVEWYASMKNPSYRVATGGFDNLVRAPRVIRDHQGYKMYYTGQNGNSVAIGLATSTDGKVWQRHSNTPVLSPDTVGSWDSLGQAFCDVYYDDTTYYMWFAGGDGVHGAIGLAKSSDGISWTRVPGNPVFTQSTSGWDSGYVSGPNVIRVGNTFYMFYGGSANRATVKFAVGLATSQDGIHWVRIGTSPVLSVGADWDGGAIGNLSVLYRNGTFQMWYSALSDLTGHWQIGYATSPLVMVGLGGTRSIPDAFALDQNYPNPFNPSTTIRYALPAQSHVTLSVFNILGQQVATLVDQNQEPGYHSVRFDGADLASGAYFYRIQAGSNFKTRSFVVMR